MSEPVSKAEIEDVLSSIRRLVSENTGSIRRESPEEKGPDKLVLTPAFRIDDSETSEAPEPKPEANADASAEEADASAPESEAIAAQPEADAVETQPEPEAVAEHASDPLPSEAGVQGEHSVPDPEFETEEARILSPLEQRIAELEAIVARSAAEFEPDGSEDEALPETFVFHHHVLEQGAASSVTAQTDQAEPDAAEAVSAAEGEAMAAEPEIAVGEMAGEAAEYEAEAEDMIAEVIENEPEPEEMVAEAAEDVPAPEEMDVEAAEPEPAPVMTDAVSAAEDDLTAEAEMEPEVQAAPEPEDVANDVEPVAVAPESDAWEEVADPDYEDEGEAFIDEDALREMVARMVREELQGTIGERITHNVRRMVRREIARALSLQEFD